MALLRNMPHGWKVVEMTTRPRGGLDTVRVVDPAGVHWVHWARLGHWTRDSGPGQELTAAPWAVDMAALAAAKTSAERIRLGSARTGRTAAMEREEEAALAAASEHAALEAAAAGTPVLLEGSSDSWESDDAHGGSGWRVRVGDWTARYDRRDMVPAWWTGGVEAARLEVTRRAAEAALKGTVTKRGHGLQVAVRDGRLAVDSWSQGVAVIDGDKVTRSPGCSDATFAAVTAALVAANVVRP